MHNWIFVLFRHIYIRTFAACNSINSQLDATIMILLIISISSTYFGQKFRPSSGALDCVYSLWYNAQAASSVHCTTSCKHSLALLMVGEIIVRNMLSWLKLLIKLLLLHLVGCLYYCISDARSHKHQICAAFITMR